MDLPIACIYCYNIAIGKQLDRRTEDWQQPEKIENINSYMLFT